MYSLVLMTAMATTPDTVEFNGFFRNLFTPNGCNGCNGCGGGQQANTFSNGCCGGGCTGSGFLGLRSRFANWSNNNGCNGGCCGGGCCGGGIAYSCMGSSPYYGCFGSGVTMVPYVPSPDFAAPMPYAPRPYANPNIPYANPDPAPPSVIPDSRTGPQAVNPASYNTVSASPANDAARATVVVRLPADARLFADDAPLRMTGPERKFVSPPLPAGQEFTYRFRVEYERAGETVSVTKRVQVRSGSTASVEFSDLTVAKPDTKGGPANPPSAPVATEPMPTAVPVSNPKPMAAPAPMPNVPVVPAPSGIPAAQPNMDRAVITVKMPPGATLYVDDQKTNSTALVRQFTTPPLPSGQEYSYVMKAETIRDGRPEYVMQKVSFKAGDQLTVDFTNLGR